MRPSSQSPPQTLASNESIISAAPLAIDVRTRLGFPGTLRSVSPYGPYEAVEINAARNFSAYLGKDLAGCFSDEVWCNILPRVAQHELAIWHAVVAVGLLDNSVRLGHRLDDGDPNVNAAVRNYSRSIRALNERLESAVDTHCKDVVLLSCILFAVFECLQSHYQSALRHITGGTKLLMEWDQEARLQNQEVAGIYLDRRSLQPVFLSLDSQAVQLGAVDFRDHFVLPAMDSTFRLPVSFSTIQEAHVALNSIFNRLARWTGCNECALDCGSIPDGDFHNVEKRTIRAQLAAWDSAFATFPQMHYEQPATRLLILQKKIMQIFFEKGAAGPSEMEWDERLMAFEEATECAEAYMDLAIGDWRSRSACGGCPSVPPEDSRPILTVAMDIVLPLYLISAKCRTSSVRKRALKMLKACRRREGIWDSLGCAAVAEKIIEIEEEAASADGFIPECARIYMLDIRYGEDEVGEIVYKKLVPDPTGSSYAEVVVKRSAL